MEGLMYLQTHSGCSYFNNSSDTLLELLRRTSSSNHEALGTCPDLTPCMASHDAAFGKGPCEWQHSTCSGGGRLQK